MFSGVAAFQTFDPPHDVSFPVLFPSIRPPVTLPTITPNKNLNALKRPCGVLFHLHTVIIPFSSATTARFNVDRQSTTCSPSTIPLIAQVDMDPRDSTLPISSDPTLSNAVDAQTTVSPTVTTNGLSTATNPVPLAATIGLIMPNPWKKLYVGQRSHKDSSVDLTHPVEAGLNYSFGFIDAVARPAPTIGGRLRQVQPLLVFPNYTVSLHHQ